MKTHEPRDVYRLDRKPNILRRIGLAAAALAGAGVIAVAVDGGMSAAGDPPPTSAPTVSSDADCGPLWDRVRALGLPEASWESAATALGLTPRGEWISVDGLTWEHLDGKTIVVANPRSTASSDRAGCAIGADADGGSRS